MGPHFFKCGNLMRPGSWKTTFCRFNGAALFQVRKPQNYPLPWTASTQCFNGAALFQVRKQRVPPDVISNRLRLQWGRTFSSAETLISMPEIMMRPSASMGPHFFKCGNQSERAQRVFKPTGFNGAALFQVRKRDNGAMAGMRLSPRFNGAALFQVRKPRRYIRRTI